MRLSSVYASEKAAAFTFQLLYEYITLQQQHHESKYGGNKSSINCDFPPFLRSNQSKERCTPNFKQISLPHRYIFLRERLQIIIKSAHTSSYSYKVLTKPHLKNSPLSLSPFPPHPLPLYLLSLHNQKRISTAVRENVIKIPEFTKNNRNYSYIDTKATSCFCEHGNGKGGRRSLRSEDGSLGRGVI